MIAICKSVKKKYSLISIAMVHRLGFVPIGQESVVIAVSSTHRKAAWKAGEEALELCKKQVEIWKRELFGDIDGGVWRANRDEATGTQAAEDEKESPPDVASHSLVIRPPIPGGSGDGLVAHPSDS
jgi:molybdopterin synthase catalytic subunit